MKKFLPLILLLVGIIVVVAAYFFVVRKPSDDSDLEEDTSALIEVDLKDRPLVELVPREDGRWIDMKISKLGLFEAESFDYEILFEVPNAGLQGTGGNIRLTGEDIEREILIGTESSGRYHYYNNVESGTFSLRFRNDKGRLVARFTTDFIMTQDTDTLASKDGKFTIKLDDEYEGPFVIMDSFGLYVDAPGEVASGPYGVFAPVAADEFAGEVTMDGSVHQWSAADSAWNPISDDELNSLGVFIGTK